MDEKVTKKSPKIGKSNVGSSFELEPNKVKKKKHKERKKKHGTDKTLVSDDILRENCTGGEAPEEESNPNKRKNRKGGKDSEMVNSNIVDDKKMQVLDDNQQIKLKKRKNCDGSFAGMQEMAASKPSKKCKEAEDNEFKSKEGDPHLVKSKESEDDDQGKKMKKKKKKLSNESKSKENNEFKSNKGDPASAGVETREADARCSVTEVDDQGKKMKTKKKTKAGSGKSSKRVTFSDKVEVCCDGFVRGKRYTPEEDKKIIEAVDNYIEAHGLGDEGLDMVLHCKSHRKIRNCWKEIGAVFPERHYLSVYSRAHILLERDGKRKWSPEELEFIRKVQEQHGSDWRMIAEAMGKSRFHVKDAWRRIKFTNVNRGRWSQEEYQNLFDLVNLDLRVRAEQEYKKSKHGMLRDNISWEAIGNKLATRNSSGCCKKWYEQLTSPMVSQGMWSDTDDYRMTNALFNLDACCMEEVDWDNLLEHRSGDVCRKRWNQMIQHIGEHGGKSFAEQVEILAKRFCPDLLEAREAFDTKPVVC